MGADHLRGATGQTRIVLRTAEGVSMRMNLYLWRQVKISPRTSDASCISDMLKRGVVAAPEPPPPPLPPSASSASRSSAGLTAQLQHRQGSRESGDDYPKYWDG